MAAEESGAAGAAPDKQSRVAAVVFGIVLAAALPIILYQGRQQWFFLDEWDFLSARRATNFGELMRPHNEHWSTVPIIVYRVLFHLVGLRHYWPYQLCLVLLHLTVAALLWKVMRRAGVHPWVATAAASLFTLFGAGSQNIEYAFQIGFTGSLAFGLAFVLCTDHDGGLRRRDALGFALGALSLMSSGVGVVMVVSVGIAALIRRGWRVALALTGPLGGLYLLWYARYGRKAAGKTGATASTILTFSRVALANTFEQLGQVSGMGFVLGAVLVVGVILTLHRSSAADLRRHYAATAGLALGSLVFAVTTAYGRSGNDLFGSQGQPRASRYVYVLATLLLPITAASASRLAAQWRPLVVVAVAVFVVGLPGNIRELRPTGAARFALGQPSLIVALAEVPEARQVPRDFQPMAFAAAGMTEGWLLDARAAGRLPKRQSITPAVEANAVLLLSLHQVRAEPRGQCAAVTSRVVTRLRTGQEIVLPVGFASIQQRERRRQKASALYLVDDELGRVVRVERGPLELRIQLASGTAKICGQS